MGFFNVKILFRVLLTTFLLKTPLVYASVRGPTISFDRLSTNEVDSREQLLQLGADQCSATYCTTGNNGSTPTFHCCKGCSCSADCWYYGNCCPDVTHPKPTHNPPNCTADYIQNGYYYYYLQSRMTPSQFDIKYYVIDTCPLVLTVADLENNYKCARNYSQEESFTLDDIVYVHENRTHTIYRNKYCAMCNDVQNTTRWRLSVTMCSDALLYLPIDEYERAQHLVSGCLLQSIPPDDLTVYDFAVCEQYDIGSCPDTTTSISRKRPISNSFLANDYVRQACSFSAFPAKGALATYKNIFCLMCNDGMQNQPPVDLNCDEAFPKGLDQRELSVLDIDYRNDLRDETSVCEIDEVFDHVGNVCRPLICPVTQAAVNGKCIPNEQIPTKYAFKIMLQFYPIIQVVFKQGDTIEPNSTLKKISRDLSINETSCPLIGGNIEIYTEQDSSYIDRIYFALFYYWTETCTAYYMASKVSDLYESSYKHIISILLNFTLEEFYFILKFAPSSKAHFVHYGDENGNVNGTESHINFTVEHEDLWMYDFFPFKKIDRCPIILLNKSEYCDVVNRMVGNRLVKEMELRLDCNDTFLNASDVFNKEDINGTTMMSVCVKDYFKLFEKKNVIEKSVTGIVSLSAQSLPCKVWLLVLVFVSVMFQ